MNKKSKGPVHVFLIFTLAYACTSINAAESIRESIIRGYNEQCIKVNSQKGLDEESIRKLCNCETRVFDENYSTMSMVMLGMRAEFGEKPSDEELNEIRKKLRACSE